MACGSRTVSTVNSLDLDFVCGRTNVKGAGMYAMHATVDGSGMPTVVRW